MTASYPALRMRRGRSSAWIREMLAEHRLHPSDLIWPLFVCEGQGCEEPIASLPGVSRWTIDRLGEQAKLAADAGIPCLALFPNTPQGLRTEDAREALNPNNLICEAIKAIKDAVPEIGVLTDVALDPYTAHGHDGLTDDSGRVLNDETVAILALFPNTPQGLRTEDAREALNPNNLICEAIKAIKDAVPEIGVLTDVALDPYTAHGHDGLTDNDGRVLNDETVAILAQQAMVQAAAGADIVAPSDMMDGRVAAIRQALEESGHQDVAIMAYAAKYASAFYGPFRDAVGSAGRLTGDKRGYQMNPANIEEALREVELDLAEGADMVMVKPGLPYLDVLTRVKDAFGVPTFAYQVSGEYAMIEHAAAAGAGDRDALILETLLAFKRAGATGVLTYHALDAARLING